MPKPTAKPRLFVVPCPKLKKPNSLDPGVKPTPQEYVQTQFDLDSLFDDEGAENA